MGEPGPGVSFPLKVQTENEDFVIEMNDSNPSDGVGYDGMGDKMRCKRRKRCGQCGPCQVKENCGKCHFCVRKDVLKQTCIYRKCVYLRSKPKPYSRPQASPQGSQSGGTLSSNSVSPIMRPPMGAARLHTPFADHMLPIPPDNKPETNPFLPPNLPHHQSMPMTAAAYPGSIEVSAANRGPFQPPPVNMNMHMSISPHCMMSSPPQGPQDQNSTHVNSPPAPTLPVPPPVMNDRTMGDFRQPDQIPIPHPHPSTSLGGLTHHHPHIPHPSSHPHLESQAVMESRMPRMNFPPSMDSRVPSDSSCMYHPYSMASHFHQPGGPTYFPSSTDMFRSQLFSSMPPGYSYPPSRFHEGFSNMHFPPLGMPPTSPFPQCAQGGMGSLNNQAFPQQYPHLNQQSHGCPKNGCCPPVSPSIESDAKVMQEGYKKRSRRSSVSSFRSLFWEPWKSPSVTDDVSSTVSSDFECDIISIDDLQMNAYIRSDGCNSIEIEIDDRSVSEDFQSPIRSSRKSFMSPPRKQVDSNNINTSPIPPSQVNSYENLAKGRPRELKAKRRLTFEGSAVCLKQDLGDEGTIQLELPGHKVTIENAVLDDKLAKSSSNLEELLEFISGRKVAEVANAARLLEDEKITDKSIESASASKVHI
ncbi:hypothetical protein CHS0354_008171 [Potamilus streckersoni]|uniref:CXXC-type domain-containing protein n=1 Tax=Potamilus streckersoni TaxID=2493646 RepID=A0AAE0RWG4_9BIVA|nr:hypothetical protein CHS0354_008171 [Potamilus streckersoni]